MYRMALDFEIMSKNCLNGAALPFPGNEANVPAVALHLSRFAFR